jgi:sigma-E factor negative regulatory protein RseA
MNEELDSQLSAMFDDELPPAECELLARRLSRDELLKARWGRYAVMGAVIRAESGVRLNGPLAGRVSAVLLAEPALTAAAVPAAARRSGMRWWQPLAASALVAAVAAVSILYLRSQAPGAVLTAQQPAMVRGGAILPASVPVPLSAAAPDSYVVPHTPSVRPVVVPMTELANYVVAHSMVSSPVARRNFLSAFMTGEGAAPGIEAVRENAKIAQ